MRRLIVVIVLVGVVATACGGGSDTQRSAESTATSGAARTIEIEMRDIAFSPDTVSVEKGETVRFRFTNKGQVTHDAFIGDERAQTLHEQDMRAGGAAPEHGGEHSDMAAAISVEPGKTGQLEHTFEDAGTVLIGCHEEGHYAAGMKVKVEVS